MDKDLSKNKLPNNKYFNAKNIKIITHGGTSTTAVETEKGTILSFELPTTQNIYRIRRVDTLADPATTTNSISITHPVPGGTQTATFSYPSITWPNAPQFNEDIYETLIGSIALQNFISQGYFDIYLADSDEWVYIVGLDQSLTVSITGTLKAGLYQIFTGAGTVSLSAGVCDAVYPQWWGAVGDDSTDCIWTTSPGLIFVFVFIGGILLLTIFFQFAPKAKGVKKFVYTSPFKKKRRRR